MTAPRARELAEQPAPPDLLAPRRGGRPSSRTESAAGRRRGLVRSARSFAAAALLALSGALALPATAEAQNCMLNTGDVWCGVVTVGTATSEAPPLAMDSIPLPTLAA